MLTIASFKWTVLRRKCSGIRVSTMFWLMLMAGIVFFGGNFFQLKGLQNATKNGGTTDGNAVSRDRFSYIVYGKDPDSGHLKHIFEVFSAFGYKRNALESDDWHVLWAHDYPFGKLRQRLKSLKPHQRVNHFPGSGFITNKLELATMPSRYIPKAFKIPADEEAFLKYAKSHPDKMFVQKSNDHRGIKIKSARSSHLTTGETFAQEFVDKPLLVDGYKFDIGVYTAITSVDPLRVYIYHGDKLFRFCPVKYHPFDPNNTDKYVIGDDYLPIWRVPSLKKYFGNGRVYTMKEAFDRYFISEGKNTEILWRRIEEAIAEVCLAKEGAIATAAGKYLSKRNFFEMVRFDFAVDEDLNVFIMEANMSPNLSSAHFPPNRLLYLQVLFNLFTLVGLAHPYRLVKSHSEMEVSSKNLLVYPERCSERYCDSCFSPECQACVHCLSNNALEYLKDAYIEHKNRGDFKRVFPPSSRNVSEDEIFSYDPDNQLLVRWFRGKCKLDATWC